MNREILTLTSEMEERSSVRDVPFENIDTQLNLQGLSLVTSFGPGGP